MINLTLIRRSSPPVAYAVAQAFQGTSLNVQPAVGAGAPTAPADPFPRTTKPTADFEAVRAGLRPPFSTTVVDLSVAHLLSAGTAALLPIQGTAYFIDKGADVGLATLHIQDQTTAPTNSINVFPGDANNNVPFSFIVIENTAQAGKVLRIHYGTDIQFLPGLGGNIVFTGGVSISQTAAGSAQGADQAVDTGASYAVGVGLAPSVGNINVHQLWNPGPKRVYVDVAEIANATAADSFAVGLGNAQLGAGTVFGPLNLKNGGAAGQAQSRFVQQAGFPNTRYDSLAAPVNTLASVLKAGPIILDANFGLHVAQLTANSQTFSRFKWREY